jgi:hypothetical protein
MKTYTIRVTRLVRQQATLIITEEHEDAALLSAHQECMRYPEMLQWSQPAIPTLAEMEIIHEEDPVKA